MKAIDGILADAAVRRALATSVDEADAGPARELAAFIAAAAGPAAIALIHYGSRAHASTPDPASAYDFFLVVDAYGAAYRALRASVGTSYRPGVAAALNHVLPPNVIAIKAETSTGRATAKIAVLSMAHLRDAASGRARDQFVVGRLFQRVQLAWVRDDAARRAVLDAISEIRARTFEWAAPSLPPVFDAQAYTGALLRRSYASEIRPEAKGRVDEVIDAQVARLAGPFDALLQALARAGVVMAEGAGAYRLAKPVSGFQSLRSDLYFAVSKARATARWAKYVILYEGWPDYIAAKVSRRTGVPITLDDRERRFPLIFLWPRFVRFLRHRGSQVAR